MRSIIMSLFLLCYFANYGQKPCTEIAEELIAIDSKFSRNDIELSKSKADSLLRMIDTCPEALMYHMIIDGRYDMKKGNFDTADTKLDGAYEMAGDQKNILVQKHILIQKAILKSKLEEYEIAIALHNKNIALPCPEEDIECFKSSVKSKINISIALKRMGNHEEAIINYQEAISLLNEYNFNDSIYRVSIYNGIGNIYDTEIDDKKASLSSYKKALRFCPQNHRSRFSVQNNIASRFLDLGQRDSARFYQEKTINSTKLPAYLVVPYQNLGDMEMDDENSSEAIKYYSLAVENAIKSGNKNKIYFSKLLLGRAYYFDKNYSKAKNIFEEVDAYYNKTKISKSIKVEIEKYLLLTKIALQNPENSISMLRVFKDIDSLKSLERVSELDNSISKYEKIILKDSLQKSQLLASSQSLKVKNQRLSISLLALLSLLGVSVAVYFYKNFKRKETEITELVFENDELNALNANLESKLAHALVNLKKSSSNSILIQVRRKKVNVEFKELKYITAEDFGVRLHLKDKSYWTDLPLKEILEKLPANLFLQIFRSTIINVNELEKIESSKVILKDGTNFKIGRSFKKAIQEILSDKS